MLIKLCAIFRVCKFVIRKVNSEKNLLKVVLAKIRLLRLDLPRPHESRTTIGVCCLSVEGTYVVKLDQEKPVSSNSMLTSIGILMSAMIVGGCGLSHGRM